MRTPLRSLLVCSVLASSALGVTACGSGHGTSSQDKSPASRSGTGATTMSAPRFAPTAASLAPDGDRDNDQSGSRHDPDDDEVLTFGQAAGAADRSALTELVTHYYTVAAADDGAKACALLYSPTVESIIEEHEGANGPPSLRGHTCAQVATKLFAQHHRELTRQVVALEVTEVQVKGNRGLVRLRFAATPEHLVAVQREGGRWKVGVLLDELGV